MSLTSSLTPAMQRIIEQMERAGHNPLYKMTPQQARAYYERNAQVLDLPEVKLPRVQDIQIPVKGDGFLNARLYAPSLELNLPVLLFLHGGGFTIGSVNTHDSVCRQFAFKSGAAVLSLDYRLAPEHKYPAAVDDTWLAYEWVHRFGHTIGLDGSRIAIGGDSAGGTLAAVCAIMARDAGLPLVLQVLLYPGTTAYQDTPSHQKYATNPIIPRESITWFFNQYITHEQRTDWQFAPLLHDDLQGVAPAWIGLAEIDPLIDEGVSYADHLRFFGVHVELEIYQGVTHEFIKFGRAVPEAVAAHQAVAQALIQAFDLPQKN